jgi:hypothetical protein
MFTLITGGSGQEQSPTFQKKAFQFVSHELAAIAGSLMCGLFLLVRLDGASAAHQHSVIYELLVSQYSPAFWVGGLFLGFVINYHTQNRSACWLGTLNMALLIVIALIDVRNVPHNPYYRSLAEGRPWRYEYRLFFSLHGGDEFAKLFFVGPILGSVAYSIGARLGLRNRKKHNEIRSATEA